MTKVDIATKSLCMLSLTINATILLNLGSMILEVDGYSEKRQQNLHRSLSTGQEYTRVISVYQRSITYLHHSMGFKGLQKMLLVVIPYFFIIKHSIKAHSNRRSKPPSHQAGG